MDALRLCLGTLTVLPVRPPGRVDRRVAGLAMALAPIAAAVLAVVAGPALWLLGQVLSPVLAAALTIGLLALLTRGMHLDGLADTADGLGSGGPADRALDVMRRGDVGPFGVVTLVVVLLVQVAALGSLGPGRSAAALTVGLAVSRGVLPLLCLRGVPAARPEGLGHLVAGTVSVSAAALSVLLAAVLVTCALLVGAWAAGAVRRGPAGRRGGARSGRRGGVRPALRAAVRGRHRRRAGRVRRGDVHRGPGGARAPLTTGPAPHPARGMSPRCGDLTMGHACPSGPRGAGGDGMTDQMTTQVSEPIDELGPVDWIVVEFPGSRFKGEIAPALEDLVTDGIVRVLDLLLIKKGDDGTLDFYELSDLDESEIGSLRTYETELAMLLSEEDVASVAAAVEPGSTAALLVWENTWAAPFASAVRRAGGQLVSSGRIPVQALLAAIERDLEEED